MPHVVAAVPHIVGMPTIQRLLMLPPVWCVTGKEVRLKGFEFPKAVHLDPEPFSIDNDLITPKMSLKRPQLLKYYQKQVGNTSSGSMKDISAYYAE